MHVNYTELELALKTTSLHGLLNMQTTLNELRQRVINRKLNAKIGKTPTTLCIAVCTNLHQWNLKHSNIAVTQSSTYVTEACLLMAKSLQENMPEINKYSSNLDKPDSQTN